MMDRRVTASFALSEFLRSDIAVRRGIANVPGAAELASITDVLAPGLQRVRDLLGVPVQITSGFRCVEVNRLVVGAASSQHVLGLAADFVAPGFGPPRAVARFLASHVAELGIDQLIYEGTWVHVSFARGDDARGQILTAHFSPAGAPVTYSRGIA